MSKFFIPAIIVLSLSLYWTVSLVGKQSKKIDALQASLESAQSITETERLNAKAANERALANQVKADEVTNQVNVMRKCIDAGTCGVRWKYQACPQLPSDSTTASQSESTETDASHRREFEQNYFNLLESIRLTRVDYEDMQKELKIRADPKYCQPTK